MKLTELIKILEKKFPLKNKEEWDNVGLLIGETKASINRIMISLDLSKDVITKAIENKIDLIITHHPIMFKALKNINNTSVEGKKIINLIKNNINLYSIHTNCDSSKNGLNDYILKKLGIQNSKIMDSKNENLYKLSVYTPKDHEELILKKIEKYILNLEDYESVNYTTDYIEKYNPVGSSKPYLGEINQRSFNEVKKINIIFEKENLNLILQELKKVHPYEKPAYEIIELENKIERAGIGRVFNLSKEIKLSDYIKYLKKSLNIENIRAVYNQDKYIKKIALVNGSGASYIRLAKKYNVDLFISGDIKYHEAFDALEANLSLLDIGHYESEIFFCEMLKEILGYVNKELEILIYKGNPVFRYE